MTCLIRIVGYCAGWSLDNLLRRGFAYVPIRPFLPSAKHLETATLHMVNYIGTMQGEFAGPRRFRASTPLLAPFVRRHQLDFGQIRQDIQKLIYGLNVPSRRGWQTPFSNLTFDWTVPADLVPRKAIVGGREMDFAYGELQAERWI